MLRVGKVSLCCPHTAPRLFLHTMASDVMLLRWWKVEAVQLEGPLEAANSRVRPSSKAAHWGLYRTRVNLQEDIWESTKPWTWSYSGTTGYIRGAALKGGANLRTTPGSGNPQLGPDESACQLDRVWEGRQWQTEVLLWPPNQFHWIPGRRPRVCFTARPGPEGSRLSCSIPEKTLIRPLPDETLSSQGKDFDGALRLALYLGASWY